MKGIGQVPSNIPVVRASSQRNHDVAQKTPQHMTMFQPELPPISRDGRLATTRIDPAHPRVDEPLAPTSSTVSACDGIAAPPAVVGASVPQQIVAANPAQLRRQARQLARHLRNKQCELDRREAQLHAQIAALEDESRKSRMWVRAKTEYFSTVERELCERKSAIEQQAGAVAAAELAADDDFLRRERRLQQREQALARAEHSLNQERRRLDARAEALDAVQKSLRDESAQARAELDLERQTLQQQRVELEQRQHRLIRVHDRRRDAQEELYEKLKRRLAEHDPADIRNRLKLTLDHLEGKRRQLDKQEATLVHQLAEVEAQRKQFVAEMEQERAGLVTLRRSMESQQLQVKVQLERDRQQLREREEAVEHQSTVIERMRAEIAAMQREALETRLAAEQLQAQISAKMSPGKVTKALAERRAQLADWFSLEQRVLAERQSEIRQAAEELLGQQAALNQQRDQLRQWLQRQQDDLEQQAARLIAREHELDRKEQSFREREQNWAQQRRELQEQVRLWMSQTRGERKAA